MTVSFDTLEDINQLMDEFLWSDRDQKQRAKCERILEAATGLFVRFGYRKTSIDDVAREAGIAKGTVYLYYRNKAELVFHTIALEKRAYVNRLAPVLDPARPASERLRLLVEIGFVLSEETPLLTRFSSGDGDIAQAMREVDTSVLAQINEFQTEFMVGLLDEASDRRLSRETLAERAHLLVDMIYAVTVNGRMVAADMTVAEYARGVAGILVDGVLNPSPVEKTVKQGVFS
jgi:AcrR family transcriptional regulator